MKTKKYQSNEERSILTALVVHDGVLGRVHRHIGNNGDHPFQSKWSNLVAKWCLDYFGKYGKAPRASIRGIFEDYAASAADKEAVELVEGFLSGLDADYKALGEDINEDFVVDRASAYFHKVQLERTREGLDAALESNDLEEAEKLLASCKRVSFSSTALKWMIDPETVKEDFRKAEEAEHLIEFPEDLGVFLSPHFKRGDFVAFAGPDKRGKSYWLLEVVWRAVRQRRRVLYYVLGDMSEEEARKRFYVRMTRRPSRDAKVCLPTAIHLLGKDEAPEIDRKGEEVRKKVTAEAVASSIKKLLLNLGRSKLPIQFRCEGGTTLSAGGVEQDVKDLGDEGWPPDVVVVDYADLLDVEPHTRNQEVRHQINATWAVLRRIALQNHCLVVVATQTAATAYGASVIRKKDFSEDKRKNAHVTGMIGINQSDAEKEAGVYRLNWVVLRDGRWSERQVCWTAGCLDIACPCIVSSLNRKKRNRGAENTR